MMMPGGSMGGSGPLEPTGVNFSNLTQATDFLAAILNDDELKVVGNAYARYFWYGIAVVIGIATVINVTEKLTLRERLRAAVQNKSRPARPQNVAMRWLATITAMTRESTYLQFTPTKRLLWFKVPPMGTIGLVLSHFAFVLALEFINNDVAGAQFWQARGVRAGWLAVAQMPLLILLVGKNNIIGLLSGVSHERLNVLHRWTARILLFLAILHFGYQSYGWQQYGLMTLEWATDECPPTGIAAFALLLWMNLSTLAPFRRMSYELFVIQHMITFWGFIIALMYHLPDTALISRVYVYILIALWVVDRIIRGVVFALLNSRGTSATLTALDGDATKVRISNKALKNWGPGSYVLLSIPKFGWLESHPATIVSTPQSHNGDLVFILKCQKGFTKRIMSGANDSSTALLLHTKQESAEQQNGQVTSYRAFINGPYGGSQADFAAFDSVCLMAGSTGITFTLSLLGNLAERASNTRLALRRLHLVWCVKDTSWTQWCSSEIQGATSRLRDAGVEVDVSVHVTCADGFTEAGGESKECGCACDQSLGPCCCVTVDDSTSEEERSNSQGSKEGKAMKSTAFSSATFYSGRPNTEEILTRMLDGANGESGVAVCGPIAMSAAVRKAVVRLSDERAIHKGTGQQGCYLHVESFT